MQHTEAGEITSNIAGVAQAAESTSRGAGDAHKASIQLVEMSAQLQKLIQREVDGHGENGQESIQLRSSRPERHSQLRPFIQLNPPVEQSQSTQAMERRAD